MTRSPGRPLRTLRVVLSVLLCFALVPLSAGAANVTPSKVSPRVTQDPKPPANSTLDANGYPYVPGELLVKYADGVSTKTAADIDAAVGARLDASFTSKIGWKLVRLPKALSVEAAATRYRSSSVVQAVQPNYLHHIDAVPNDPLFDQLWGMDNQGQLGGMPGADISAPEAWDLQTGDGSVVVAVIDTGVDYNHPDLTPNIWTNPGEIPGNGIDDDGNGYIDDVHGMDFFNYDSDPMDDHGHGTHCSGTIGAVGDNGIGVAGVNWDVKIMPMKFLSADGWGDTAGAIQCIEYADMMGADVMSNSWGGGPYEQALADAIASTDALFVAAAGNDSMDTDAYPNYPSCYDSPNVLAVGATDMFDSLAWFSNWGAETVDVFAPGDGILSTIKGNPPTFVPDTISSVLVSDCNQITDWDTTQYEKDPWELDTGKYVSPPASIAQSQYRDKEDSWIKSVSPVDLSSFAGAALRFQAYYDTEDYIDFLHAWVSTDGTNWTEVGSMSGYSDGFKQVTYDISSLAGASTVYVAFSLTTDSSVSSDFGFTGVAVDDVEIVEMDPLFTDNFSDLSNWDTSSYVTDPWALESDYFVSAPTAAGVLGYHNNENARMTLASPLDMSGVTGGAALQANVFYQTEPGFDILRVVASTDGANWEPVASYSGFSGMYEPGFVPITVDLSSYAGASEVWVGFEFTSNEMYDALDGLIGVAVDDVSVLTGVWNEADYSTAYEWMSGTSMATPHVAGIAALVLAEWPGRSAEDLKSAIIKSADYVPALDGMCVANGRANASLAIQDLWGPEVTDDNAGAYTARAEITLSATDDSGVRSISYAFDDDGPTTVYSDTAVAINTVPAARHTLTYWGEDDLGNVSDPVTVEFSLERGAVSSLSVAGADRFATAVAASKASFPDGADTVVIATGRNWPDALGGTALAGAVDGPILLTDTTTLPDTVATELERLGADTVYLLGGESAASDAVVAKIEDATGIGSVTRLAGADRYETARMIADEVIAIEGEAYDGLAFVATGANFPDALAAAPIARHRAWPVLLADGYGGVDLPGQVSSAVILGGEGAVPAGVEAALIGRLGEANVTRKGASDRYGTAALVAAWSSARGLHWEGVGISTGVSFADALAGGAMLGQMRSVMLLTPPNQLVTAARSPLSVNKDSIQTVHFIGGTSAVSQGVRDTVMLTIR